MDVGLFDTILTQVAPLTEQVALHLMGEPLVHGKLSELLEVCAKNQTPVFLVTNGTLLTEAKAQLLLHPILRQVNFSLHSFHDNFPGQDPTSYLERIFAYVEEAFERRPDLYLNFRLWNLSAPDASRDSNQMISELIEHRFGTPLPTEVDVRSQKGYRLKNRLYIHYDTEFVWPDLSLPVIGTMGTCYGLRSHIGILADGTVVPCCLDKEGSIPLGNIQEAPLETILNSEKAQTLLRGFLDRKLLNPLCQRCDYVTRF
jgi:radical SAM protein with 4Fe4S-binding SPASM domain